MGPSLGKSPPTAHQAPGHCADRRKTVQGSFPWVCILSGDRHLSPRDFLLSKKILACRATDQPPKRQNFPLLHTAWGGCVSVFIIRKNLLQ